MIASLIYGGSQTKSVAKNGDKEITLQVSGVNGTNNFASEKNFDYDSNWSGLKRTLVSGATIESDGTLTTQNISITGKYYNLDISQTSLEGKAFTGKIYVTNHSCSTSNLPGYYTILLNNSNGAKTIDSAINYIKGKGTPDFSKIADTNEGMYAAEDDLGTSYYFRGAVNNNWVKFGKDSSNKDMYWRIIRINGDNSIRMIYTGTTDPSTNTSVKESNGVYMTGANTQIGTSNFNNSYNKSEYVGYMYTDGEQHGNSTSSTIKSAIDNWYKTTLASTDSLNVVDTIYCNDRSPAITQTSAWTSTVTYYYGATERIINSINPILLCPITNDMFTLKSSNVGNKILDFPVGLITADEQLVLGNSFSKENKSSYLYTGQEYWLITPAPFYSGGDSIQFIIDSFGTINRKYGGADYGVRPVISLSSSIRLSGDGTYNNPYTLSEN